MNEIYSDTYQIYCMSVRVPRTRDITMVDKVDHQLGSQICLGSV